MTLPAVLLSALAVTVSAAGPFAPESYEARPGLINLEGYVIYYNAQGPLSMVSMTRSEFPKGAIPSGRVEGKSCQHGLQIPFSATLRPAKISGAIGDGGYRKVLGEIYEDNPGIIGLYDVKVDQQVISILGIYRRVCTEVSAYGLMMRETEPKTDLRNEKVPPYLLER